MAFSTPTLNDLVRSAENGLSVSFGGEVSVLRKGVLKVLARVFAGTTYLLVLVLRNLWKNVFITTCDVETLVNFGRDFDIPNKPESYARGRCLVKAESTSVSLPQGTVLETADGMEFETVADMVLAGGTSGTSVPILAVEPGETSNIASGTELSFRDGIPEGVEDSVVIDSEGTGGGRSVDVVVNGNAEKWGESVEEYRNRLLDYRRNPPHGGSASDYKSWAERFAQVSRCVVFPDYPETGCVTCALANFTQDDSVSLNSDEVAEVRNYLSDDVRRPVTANVIVNSCIERSVNFEIGISPNNSAVRASVLATLRSVLRQYGPGDIMRTSDITARMISATTAERVAVIHIDNVYEIALDKSRLEMPVVGSTAWVDYE